MSSLKKNFSIAKLYSDLEKYESNLDGFKNSRLKKQASGTSLHQRPSSTNKTHEFKNSYNQPDLSRFEKSRLQLPTKSKYTRPFFEKYKNQQKKNLYDNHQRQKEIYRTSYNSSIQKENIFQDRQQKENRKSHNNNAVKFNKSDQLYFLNECNKLYNLKSRQNTKILSSQEQADSVRILLNQINKRDKVYDLVTKKLGHQNLQNKIEQFFQSYERMTKIIAQFKRMSKLDIEDQQQLYQFLINQQEDPKQKQQQASNKNQNLDLKVDSL